MSRDPRGLLEEVRLPVERGLQALGRFSINWIRGDAVFRNLEIIGEAVEGLPAGPRRAVLSASRRANAGPEEVFVHACLQAEDRAIGDLETAQRALFAAMAGLLESA